MPSLDRSLLALLAVGLFAFAAPSIAQKADAAPKPDTYLCPNADRGRRRLLPARGRAPLHDVPAGEEHRDHRVRLREVRPRASTARRASTASTSTGVDHPSLPVRAARGHGQPRRGGRASRDARPVAEGARRAQVESRRDRRPVQGARRQAVRRLPRAGAGRPRGASGRQGTRAATTAGLPAVAKSTRTERRRAPPRTATAPRGASDPAPGRRSSARAERSPAPLPGFRFRSQQLAMADAVAAAIAQRAGADRRGRHRHRQDLRLPRPGAALRRQGDRVDGHEDAAGPALPARPAARPRRARRCR